MIRFPTAPIQSLAEIIGRHGAIITLNFYRRLISPFLLMAFGPACRFEPSCSAYAIEAISEYGLVRGGWMSLRRLIRCRPGGGWGYDPPINRPRSAISLSSESR